METITLYCAGCGQVVCQTAPGELLAVSCRCGALAPVLYHGGGVHPPFSLISALLNSQAPPHVEYYLGYSDHMDPLRCRVETLLRAIGATSQANCKDQRCREAYRQGRERWTELAEEQERQKRIAEIGEP